MESQPQSQNPESRTNPENFHPCNALYNKTIFSIIHFKILNITSVVS